MRILRLRMPVAFALVFCPALVVQMPIALCAQGSASPAAAQVEANRKELNTIFKDYWEDRLKHEPEFASTLGDKRYNDQISDYSVKAYNAGLEREQTLMMRRSRRVRYRSRVQISP